MIDAEAYIARHIIQERIPWRLNGEAEASGRRSLRQPIAPVDYGEDGNVSVGNSDVDLSFSYTPLDQAVNTDGLEDNGVYRPDYRKLRNFTMIDTNGNRLSLLGLSPQVDGIIFNPQDSIDENAFYASSPHNLVVISGNGDMAKPSAIIRALHEIGHGSSSDDREQVEIRRKWKEGINPIGRSELAKIIEAERRAWAFAFNVLRPFIKTGEENAGHTFFRDRLLLYARVKLSRYIDDVKQAMTTAVH